MKFLEKTEKKRGYKGIYTFSGFIQFEKYMTGRLCSDGGLLSVL